MEIERRGFLRGLFAATVGGLLVPVAGVIAEPAQAIILPDDDPIWLRLRGANGFAMNGLEPVGVMRRVMLDYTKEGPFHLEASDDVYKLVCKRLKRYGDDVRLAQRGEARAQGKKWGLFA